MFRRRAHDQPEGALAGTRYLLRVKLPAGPLHGRAGAGCGLRDTYGVAVAPGHNDALVLADTVCIDHLTEHDR